MAGFRDGFKRRYLPITPERRRLQHLQCLVRSSPVFRPVRTVFTSPRSHSSVVDLGAKPICRLQQHRLRFRAHAAHDERHPILDDSRLFPGDGTNVVPEKLLVVQPNIRDDREQRLRKNVGAVEPPAHSRFQDHHIHVLFGEPYEGHTEGPLKKRRHESRRFDFRTHALNEFHHPLFFGHGAIDAHALTEVLEMG